MKKSRRTSKPLPPHDGTRLGRELAELEAENPEVAKSAENLREFMERVYYGNRYGLRVDPKNLQVDDPEQE